MKPGTTSRMIGAGVQLSATIAGLFGRHRQAQTIAIERVSIRCSPSADSRAVTTVDTGSPLKLVGRDSLGIWLQVETSEGAIGWVSTVFVGSVTPIRQLPVVWTAPQRASRMITARHPRHPSALH